MFAIKLDYKIFQSPIYILAKISISIQLLRREKVADRQSYFRLNWSGVYETDCRLCSNLTNIVCACVTYSVLKVLLLGGGLWLRGRSLLAAVGRRRRGRGRLGARRRAFQLEALLWAVAQRLLLARVHHRHLWHCLRRHVQRQLLMVKIDNSF